MISVGSDGFLVFAGSLVVPGLDFPFPVIMCVHELFQRARQSPFSPSPPPVFGFIFLGHQENEFLCHWVAISEAFESHLMFARLQGSPRRSCVMSHVMSEQR